MQRGQTLADVLTHARAARASAVRRRIAIVPRGAAPDSAAATSTAVRPARWRAHAARMPCRRSRRTFEHGRFAGRSAQRREFRMSFGDRAAPQRGRSNEGDRAIPCRRAHWRHRTSRSVLSALALALADSGRCWQSRALFRRALTRRPSDSEATPAGLHHGSGTAEGGSWPGSPTGNSGAARKRARSRRTAPVFVALALAVACACLEVQRESDADDARREDRRRRQQVARADRRPSWLHDRVGVARC